MFKENGDLQAYDEETSSVKDVKEISVRELKKTTLATFKGKKKKKKYEFTIFQHIFQRKKIRYQPQLLCIIFVMQNRNFSITGNHRQGHCHGCLNSILLNGNTKKQVKIMK